MIVREKTDSYLLVKQHDHALVSGEFGGTGEFLLTYVAGPVLGAVLAAVVYFRIFILPGAREPGGLEPVG